MKIWQYCREPFDDTVIEQRTPKPDILITIHTGGTTWIQRNGPTVVFCDKCCVDSSKGIRPVYTARTREVRGLHNCGGVAMTQQKHIELYTDGACSGNPGPGGWCAILHWNGHERVLRGGEPHTTNNRMELTAVIEGLAAIKEPCKVTVFTDSQYVVGIASLGWKRKANLDLIYDLDALCAAHDVTFKHVRGHAGHPLNERCDRIACKERDKARKT